MTKRKAPTTGTTRQTKTPRRASTSRASAPTLSVDEDIFIPATFGQDPASCNGVTPDDDGTTEDVFIPATFGQHQEDDACSWCSETHDGGPEACPALHPERTERSERFERARQLDRLGFSERGICKYGCRGTESPNVPLVGWHLKTCQFWDDAASALPDEPFH